MRIQKNVPVIWGTLVAAFVFISSIELFHMPIVASPGYRQPWWMFSWLAKAGEFTAWVPLKIWWNFNMHPDSIIWLSFYFWFLAGTWALFLGNFVVRAIRFFSRKS